MLFPYTPLDLTHTLNSSTPSWDGTCGFTLSTKLDYNECTTNAKFRVQHITMHAGIGTHIDAPAHCIPGGTTIDALPLTDLITPCVMIDVSKQVDAHYTISVDDITAFEAQHGAIQPRTCVIIHTGWAALWNQPEKYRNNHQFPSVSPKAAEYLVARNIMGLGIDTLSPDRPDSGYPVHRTLLGAGKYIIENVANADALPATGSFILALPVKIENGTEAPLRLIALVGK